MSQLLYSKLNLFNLNLSLSFLRLTQQYEYFAIAQELAEAGLHEEALKAYDEMIKLGKSGRTGTAQYWKGKSLMALGR
jgi:pentatricopeptide repeat protein